jgi:hypothetical protein
MNTRRFTYRTRVIAAAGAAAIILTGGVATGLLASPALAGESTAATQAVSSAGSTSFAASATKNLHAVSLPTGFRPEGVASGPKRTYFAGSMGDGRIWIGSLKTGSGHLLTAGVSGRALRGMEWDKRSNLLWAAGQDGTTGIVLAVDIATGAVKYRIEIPGAGFLNDLTVEPNAVWVTDSRVDRLTRIALRDVTGAKTGQINYIPLKGAWPATGTAKGANGANGIETLWDGSLLLDNSTAGGLYRVDYNTGTAWPLPVRRGPGVTGGDGLERKGHTLFVVRGNKASPNSVEQLKLHHTAKKGWRATWRKSLTSPQLDVPSTAMFVNHTLWAVTARFGVANPESASYLIVPLGRRAKGTIITPLL